MLNKATAMAAMEQADFALVTIESPSVDRDSVFPFQRSMIEYRQDLLAYARTQMLPIRKAQVAEHLFQIFERPRVEVMGSSGGWMPSTGATLKVGVAALQKFGYIVISGPTMMSTELRGSLKLNAFLLSVDGKTRVELKTLSHLRVDEYAIAIDATPAANRTESSVEISLEFPTYFVPKERGINADPRKLVVLVPRSLRLVAGPTNYPPSLTAGAKP